ncbi:MAG: 5-oxoprolinase subunit C family protein [Lutibacter sp.]
MNLKGLFMVKVLHPGLYTSIQDMGRFGYRNLGVPMSGTMDSISAGFANALLNNHKNDAVMEITMVGPQLLFTASTNLVITGAEMNAEINNSPILNYKPYTVKNGDLLTFGKLKKNGIRCYLAVSGGFQSEIILKSRSFYTGITSQELLKKNDLISFKHQVINQTNNAQPKGTINTKIPFYDTNILEVFTGPEFELFSSEEQKKLLSVIYTVSNDNNRMGYRMEEEAVKHTKSIITSPVLPGTVQLLPSGKLIILMKDAQTTGGYPRVFQLNEKSIAILAQKRAGDSLKFNTFKMTNN